LAIHPSAIKRHRQSLKKRARNKDVKSRIRTLIKKVHEAVEAKNREVASLNLKEVNRALGKAVSQGILKRNTASRWMSRLARAASQLIAA